MNIGKLWHANDGQYANTGQDEKRLERIRQDQWILRGLYFGLGSLVGFSFSMLLVGIQSKPEIIIPPARVTVVRVIEEKAVVSDVYQGGVTVVNEVNPTPVTISSPDVHMGAMRIEARFPAVKIVLPDGTMGADDSKGDGAKVQRDIEADRIRNGMEHFRKSWGIGLPRDEVGEYLPTPAEPTTDQTREVLKKIAEKDILEARK